jgi:hypothetical protein
LQIRLGGRDLGVESLATELVIDGRLSHRQHHKGEVYGDSMHTLCTSGNAL